MQFDGMKFRRNPTYVSRPGPDGYWSFFNARTGEMVEEEGRSLTNMIYSTDGRAFLAKDGHVYTTSRKRTPKCPVCAHPECSGKTDPHINLYDSGLKRDERHDWRMT